MRQVTVYQNLRSAPREPRWIIVEANGRELRGVTGIEVPGGSLPASLEREPMQVVLQFEGGRGESTLAVFVRGTFVSEP